MTSRRALARPTRSALLWAALATAASAQASLDSSDAERLRALGYIESSADSGEAPGDGVTHVDRKLAAPGHNLIVSAGGCSARLVDLEGRVLHVWKQQDCRQWWGAALTREGDLFVNGSLVGPAGVGAGGQARTMSRKSSLRFAARIARTGEALWVRKMRSHHQLDITPAGNLLVLTEAVLPDASAALVRARLRPTPDADPVIFHDNSLEWIRPDGAPLDSLSLFDAITSGPSEFPLARREKLMEGSNHLGLFHCNSAFAMDQPHLADTSPLHSRDNVLVTSRNQNRVFIVNRRDRSLVWAWGENELQAPHHATWLANGHLLVFDNGIERGTSRVLEVAPGAETGAIVWEYPGETGIPFFSGTRGMAQRLDNGNVLIVEANAGKAFEVTPQGKLAWEYHTPLDSETEKRPVVISLRRYPESWLHVPSKEQAAERAR